LQSLQELAYNANDDGTVNRSSLKIHSKNPFELGDDPFNIDAVEKELKERGRSSRGQKTPVNSPNRR